MGKEKEFEGYGINEHFGWEGSWRKHIIVMVKKEKILVEYYRDYPQFSHLGIEEYTRGNVSKKDVSRSIALWEIGGGFSLFGCEKIK